LGCDEGCEIQDDTTAVGGGGADDVLSPAHDYLKIQKAWWIVELIPSLALEVSEGE